MRDVASGQRTRKATSEAWAPDVASRFSLGLDRLGIASARAENVERGGAALFGGVVVS